MTVAAATSSVSYTGNGVTTVFAVSFVFLSSTDLAVSVAGVTKTLNTHYTVTGGSGSTGSLTFGAAPANAAAVLIERTVPVTQLQAFRAQGPFAASAHEEALDRACYVDQQNVRRIVALEALVASLIADLTALGY